MKLTIAQSVSVLVGFAAVLLVAALATAEPIHSEDTNAILLKGIQGKVAISTNDGATWLTNATAGLGAIPLQELDRVQTQTNSRAEIHWPRKSIYATLDQGISVQVSTNSIYLSTANMSFGRVHFFRVGGSPIEGFTNYEFEPWFAFHAGPVEALDRETEYVLEFVPETNRNSNRVVISVIDGKVEASGLARTRADVPAGYAVDATNGLVGSPRRFPNANDLIQWIFYYPTVLDLNDLVLTQAEEASLARSMEAYRSGDFRAALAAYPTGSEDKSDYVRIYHAALLLAAGEPEGSLRILRNVSSNSTDKNVERLCRAQRLLAQVIQRQPATTITNAGLSTEFMANSYNEQSLGRLKSALAYAGKAANGSTNGFAYQRLAEVDFCFGNIGDAEEALRKSIKYAPRNAPALALKGFLLSSKNQTDQAIQAFNEAIMLDSGLGSAWLGRGLCYYRKHDRKKALNDLEMAAVLEPQGALPRAYWQKYGVRLVRQIRTRSKSNCGGLSR